MTTMLREKALVLLRQALNNPNADFRDAQWEAIEELLLNKSRLLVVQRTGWGKSLVYFLATRLLTDQGAGCTLLISPLLALMRNQIAAAQRIGIRAETINSSNTDEWNLVNTKLLTNQVDVLLISPERLANQDFYNNILLPLSQKIGLFVVDEAHCISDWGHDFRPDYRRIVRVLQALPSNIPVLATTATANNRVVKDITDQLGQNLRISRGDLTRKSLRLQNICLPSQAARLAWLAQHLPQLPGSGIIYALTVRDAQRVADWLNTQGINAKAYYSELDTQVRIALEDELLNNEIKALVATTALGMGFDKPDLGFVIHYQRPGSVVHYYQQVGRAGRAVETAYGILLSGDEDDQINNYFINTAFPP
jgi:ATP-dependent DNA helicase RecQ